MRQRPAGNQRSAVDAACPGLALTPGGDEPRPAALTSAAASSVEHSGPSSLVATFGWWCNYALFELSGLNAMY